jgi:hypothetical protein
MWAERPGQLTCLRDLFCTVADDQGAVFSLGATAG